MMEAMRLAAFASRLVSPDPADWLSAESAFQMATQGSAELLGFSKLGRLEPGYCADIVFLDRSDLAYVPFNNFWNQLVFSETGRGVQRVMVDGRVIYENGNFITFDYARLGQQAQAAADRLAEAGAERREQLTALEPFVAQFCVGIARSPHSVNRYVAS
jgi:guanine deaminase